jgi:SAM-dependent methyltransferase
MAKTAERIDPERFDTREEYLLYLRHRFAYEYTKSRIRPTDEVVEVGSGEGYGTSLLSETAARVVGLDIDEATVEHASGKYASDKVGFALYDGNTIPFPDNTFDLAVSFQVIEHIRDDAGHVAQICRILKPGGILVLTTPNRNYRLLPGQKPWNRFHVREYDRQQLQATLRRSFPDTLVLGIRGSEEVQAIERARVAWALKSGPMTAIRRSLPEPMKLLLGDVLGVLRKVTRPGSSTKDFITTYSLGDFHVISEGVEQALDLLAVCHKPT